MVTQGDGRAAVEGLHHGAVYTSSFLALAALETLAHAEIRHLKTVRYAFGVDVPPELIEEPDLASLPDDWDQPTNSHHARAFGAEWAHSKRSVVLVVPSVLVPQERNLILNPNHPDFSQL